MGMQLCIQISLLYLQYVRYLIYSSTGFNANTLLKSDWTVLMYACDSAIVKLLLLYGADPNYIKGN